jgi:hypothetical protein
MSPTPFNADTGFAKDVDVEIDFLFLGAAKSLKRKHRS